MHRADRGTEDWGQVGGAFCRCLMGKMLMRVRSRAEEMGMEKGDKLDSSKRYVMTKVRVE